MPEFCTDVLKVISENEFDQFFRVLNTEWPTSIYAQGFINTCREWQRKSSAFDVSLYSYRENLDTGIFVGILKTGHRSAGGGIIIYALDGYENQLKQVLLKTKKIHWNKFPLFQGVMPKHAKILEEVIEKKGLEFSIPYHSTIQIINPVKVLEFEIEIPEDVFVAPLTKDDVDVIYDLWPLNNIHTKDDIFNSIELSFSFGVFSRSSNEILAWVMQAHYGAIGMLYTKENVRRHGYAKILVQMITKRMAELCLQPFATIVETNFKSIALFHSLGYKQPSVMKYYKVHD